MVLYIALYVYSSLVCINLLSGSDSGALFGSICVSGYDSLSGSVYQRFLKRCIEQKPFFKLYQQTVNT